MLLCHEMETSLSTSVVLAVADSKGVDAIDLPPLADTLDPDALDALLKNGANQGSDIEVQFTYAGHDIHVRGDEELTVEPLESPFGI